MLHPTTSTTQGMVRRSFATSGPDASNNLHKKRRLVLTLYRGLMRWCRDIPATTPLDEFIPLDMVREKEEIVMDNVAVFKRALKEEFRSDSQDKSLTERIQRGLDGLKQLHAIKPDLVKYSKQWGKSMEIQRRKQQRLQQHVAAHYNELEFVQDKLDAIPWLPAIEDCKPQSLTLSDDNEKSTKLPLFPLQGPLFHSDVIVQPEPSSAASSAFDLLLPLPLFTPQSDIPVPGMEVPLQIFEPRYRQLYQDLMTSSTQRQVLMPFCHPLQAGKFATTALVHQVTNLQEIADETNGKIQYYVEHVVTQAFTSDKILNPHVWPTKETYLQVQGQYGTDDPTRHLEAYQPLQEYLEQWKSDTSHPLATKSLTAMQTEGVWTLVHILNRHFQQELWQLQLGVATQVKRLTGGTSLQMPLIDNNTEVEFHPDVVAQAQAPHRRRLLQLLLDTSLLVPTLLTIHTAQDQCQYLLDLLQRERHFLQTNSF